VTASQNQGAAGIIPETRRPLWRGRALALAGILLVALNLRSAVASLSPLVEHIQADFPVSPFVLGLLGSAPPVCFAIFGVLTPLLARRVGLERLLVIAIVVLSGALILRGAAPSAGMLLAATVAIFAGVAVGNVVLPPLVKKYFPDRIGLVTTMYMTAMAVSTFLPPLVSVPMADAVGWRWALAQWGVLAALAVVPWVALLLRARAGRADEVHAAPTGPTVRRLWASPMAWAIAARRSSITHRSLPSLAPPCRAPCAIASLMACPFSSRGSSSVTTARSASSAATLPIAGRLTRSRSPAEPKTTINLPLVNGRRVRSILANESAVWA